MVREPRPLTRLRIGVSACLLGQPVRYDGGHKRQADLVAALEGRVDWVAVCPEVELGLGVPRETIQIEAAPDGVRLVATGTRRDLTGAMRAWAERRLDDLAREGLAGYVFKARSPSCGLGSTPIVGGDAPGFGLFAEAFRRRFPDTPAAEEGDLADLAGRERFVRRVVARAWLRSLFRAGWTAGDAVAFHSRLKLLLLAQSPEVYAQTGRLVAEAGSTGRGAFERDYARLIDEAAAAEATPGRLANALAHAFGYFSQDLPPEERAELAAALDRLADGRDGDAGQLRRAIREHAASFGHFYLAEQVLLDDEPWR